MKPQLVRFYGPRRLLRLWHKTVVDMTGRESTGPTDECDEDGTVRYFVQVKLDRADRVMLEQVWFGPYAGRGSPTWSQLLILERRK
jgi:hypothetical protein